VSITVKNLRISPATMLFVAALVGAGAFAAGRSTTSGTSSPPTIAETTTHAADPSLPPGHPPMAGHGGSASGLPPGHPAVDDTSASTPASAAESELSWKAPARWQSMPSTSSMRLATYRIPHAPGDAEDPELTVTQAGGSVDANAKRWVEQFDAAGQKTAKRSVRKVNGLEVTIVEVDGKYSGGMGRDTREEEGWSLVGAIVATPGMPHFFKLTGPTKSVKAARAELDELVSSFATR
jgi:hypothetical protein